MQTEPKGELGSEHPCIAKSRKKLRESEAPAELETPRFDRNFTLPRNEYTRSQALAWGSTDSEALLPPSSEGCKC